MGPRDQGRLVEAVLVGWPGSVSGHLQLPRVDERLVTGPHALGLAIPLVIAISTALAARNGILVKDRLALERMRTVDAVLFDKTGTLGQGGAPAQWSGRGRRR
jgi:P-type Cu2+ transporter